VAAITVDRVCQAMSVRAPLGLAESWDNVGLLVGDRHREIASLMTCLTICPRVVAEAVAGRVGMIITHHPLPFKPLHRITSDSLPGRLLLDLIAARIAIYSAHTAYDSAPAGINQRLALGIGLDAIEPLLPHTSGPHASGPHASGPHASGPHASGPHASGPHASGPHASGMAKTEGASKNPLANLGSGRCGRLTLPEPAGEVLRRARTLTASTHPILTGDPQEPVSRIAIACGSGGSFLDAARRKGCQMLITGEATFHTSLEAQASGIQILLLGHFASERFAMEQLAAELAAEFPELHVFASRDERDPIPTTT